MSTTFTIDDKQKAFLGEQAITAIETVFNGPKNASPLVPENARGTVLEKELGSFVTLNINGHLRGCIGSIIGHEPLYINVWKMARLAAFRDPRFPALKKSEWPNVEMEISVLDEPTLCPDPDKIVIGRDGLILKYANHSGVFLPQVPVEQGWNLEQYLYYLCQKAGLPPDSWKLPGASLFWYQALVFHVNRGK